MWKAVGGEEMENKKKNDVVNGKEEEFGGGKVAVQLTDMGWQGGRSLFEVELCKKEELKKKQGSIDQNVFF